MLAGWNRDGGAITKVDAIRRSNFVEDICTPSEQPPQGLVATLLLELRAYLLGSKGGAAGADPAPAHELPQGMMLRLGLLGLLHRCSEALILG